MLKICSVKFSTLHMMLTCQIQFKTAFDAIVASL